MRAEAGWWPTVFYEDGTVGSMCMFCFSWHCPFRQNPIGTLGKAQPFKAYTLYTDSTLYLLLYYPPSIFPFPPTFCMYLFLFYIFKGFLNTFQNEV